MKHLKKGEVVLPRGAVKGGETIIVNFNANTLSDGQRKEVREEIAKVLRSADFRRAVKEGVAGVRR